MFILNKNSFKNSFLKKIKLNNKWLCIFLFIILFFSAAKVNAAIFDKSSYVENEPIVTMESGGATVIFNITPDSPSSYPILNVESYLPGWMINLYDDNNRDAPYISLSPGEYAFVTLNDPGTGCFVNYLNYDECKVSPEFVSEEIFNVTPAPSGGGGDTPPVLDEELVPMLGGAPAITPYPPVVNIFSTLKNMFFSDNLVVDYKVTDQNDTDRSASYNGLADNPTSIFYSDKIVNWYDNFLGSSNKTLIAKGEPKEGKYKWSVKDLVPGVLYKIIVEAVDLAGLWSQGITDYFSVDFTAPVFTVKTNPIAVRNGDVLISIDSSEDLSKIPEVSVTQNGGETKKITMKGEKSHYEGTYTVVPLYDGTASIGVTGVDIAGNVGNVIIGGGTFSVGMNPPPNPIINKYQEKIVTDIKNIDFTGATRSDTEVVLRVNGVDVSKMKPDAKGNFTFTKILLDEKKNKGVNYINIYAVDPLGSMSEGVPIEVKYNIAPTVKIVEPIKKDVLSNVSQISVEGRDLNGDTLFYTYQVLSQNDYNNKVFHWTTLSENDPSSTFSWNTTEVEDGNYVLQVAANDGNTKTTSDLVQISVKNVLPYFRFEDGRNTVTNQSNIKIRGKTLTSVNVSPRPDIVSVAYSMDQGNTWTPVKIIKDGGNYQKKFSVEFTNLKEGTYPILWRTKDTRGFIGKVIHSIIVDQTPPKAPIVTSPKISKEIIINNNNDENINKSGIQISIKGTAEPMSTVFLIYKDKIFTTKSLITGDFIFDDVTFDMKGKYDLSLTVKDLAGNKSEDTSLSIVYNNPPVISFINPKPFGGLSGKVNLSWSIKDIDGDVLTDIIVSYRDKDRDSQFKDLVTNASAIGSYDWDTSNLRESNNYELKISVNDSFSTTTSSAIFSIDRTAPIVTSLLFGKNEVNTSNKDLSFVATGSITDNLSGVEYVEYSIENSGGQYSPWYKGIITSGYLKNKADFIIKHPLMKEDGEYKIHVRAVDRASNIGEEKTLLLSIDKTAPRIGSFFMSKNGVDISPDDNGDILIYQNTVFNFNVSLENDTESASLTIDNKNFELKKDYKSQLWNTEISLNAGKSKRILMTVSDFSGNITKDKDIGSISASSRGKVYLKKDNTEVLIIGASITIQQLNKETNQYDDFNLIDTNDSSIFTNQSGEYDLVLPAGNYRFIIKGDNINTLKYTKELSRPSVVVQDFNVSPLSGFMQFINKFLSIFK